MSSIEWKLSRLNSVIDIFAAAFERVASAQRLRYALACLMLMILRLERLFAAALRRLPLRRYVARYAARPPLLLLPLLSPRPCFAGYSHAPRRLTNTVACCC